jgi:VanZ family protein
LIWAAVIFFFSAQPSFGTGFGIWDFVLRKTAHMVEFGILFVLLWRAIRQHVVRDGYALCLAALTALIYAVSDEFHQSFVPGRTPAIRDVGFDLTGIIIAAVLVTIIWINKQTRNGGDGIAGI